MHKCILKPTLFCPIQKETDCYLVLKMSVDVGLDKDLGDLPPLQSCCNMQGCVPVLKTTQSYIHNALHPCSVQWNPWGNLVHSKSVTLLNKPGIRTPFSSLTAQLMLILILLNKSGIYTLFPDWPLLLILLLVNELGICTLCPHSTVIAHITAGEQTWHTYTFSSLIIQLLLMNKLGICTHYLHWLYNCCSFYCWWTNFDYVQLFLTDCTVNAPTDTAKQTWHRYTFSSLTIQCKLLILLLRNKTGICTLFLTDCTVNAPADTAEQTWHIYVHFFLTDRTATAHSNAGEQTDWHMYIFVAVTDCAVNVQVNPGKWANCITVLTLLGTLSLHFALIRMRVTPAWPYRAAVCRAVSPYYKRKKKEEGCNRYLWAGLA